jgi:EpsI family protein
MAPLRLSLVLASLMVLSAAGGIAARPTEKGVNGAPKYLLEEVVPKQFGDWRELPNQTAQIVNPQTKELLDSLYSQILTRTYVNSKGYKIMLSLAYGDDQRGGLQAHKPEICYPAQGFKLLSNKPGKVDTPFGSIPARRLHTSYGERYQEPVTYWMNVGDRAITNKIEKRIVELKLGLTGQIPDGLLFRISSVDSDPQKAYVAHDAFTTDLLRAVSPVNRGRLSGLADPV